MQSKKILACLLVALLVTGPVAGDVPVLQGDVDALFELRPGDCPGCTQAQIDELEDGLRLTPGLLRRELRNPAGEVCIAEASLIRDLVVMTFDELRRPGVVSRSRWQDYIRARAQIAGGLSENTKDALLQRFRAEAGAVLGLSGAALDIYAAAQYSRIFFAIAEGRWQVGDWLGALASSQGFEAELVDSMIAPASSLRQEADRILATSFPGGTWGEGQLSHLTRAPSDFLVGTVPGQLSALRQEYADAIGANPWTAGVNGCGLEAAYGLREKVHELTEEYSIVTDKHEQEREDDDRGSSDNLCNGGRFGSQEPGCQGNPQSESGAGSSSPNDDDGTTDEDSDGEFGDGGLTDEDIRHFFACVGGSAACGACIEKTRDTAKKGISKRRLAVLMGVACGIACLFVAKDCLGEFLPEGYTPQPHDLD